MVDALLSPPMHQDWPYMHVEEENMPHMSTQLEALHTALRSRQPLSQGMIHEHLLLTVAVQCEIS